MGSTQLSGLEAIARNAVSAPASPALLDHAGACLSYEELWRQIELIGKLLQSSGIERHETVAVLASQGVLQVTAVLGALHYCACAPLQPRTTLTEVQSSLVRLSASALIVAPEFEAEAQLAASLGLAIIRASAQESPDNWRTERSTHSSAAGSTRDKIALYLMTSATTGSAKIVPLTAANLNAGTAARTKSLKLTAVDRMLLMTSFCHIIGVENTMAQFTAGGSVIVTNGFDATRFLNWITELRPTWYACAPTVHQSALAQFESAPEALKHSLRFLQSAGAPLPNSVRDRLEQLLGLSVFNDYGMTEACPIAVDAFLPGGRVPQSAGRSIGLEISVQDATGNQLSPGETGEIVVRGTAVMSGYLDDPDATRSAFRHGWFRTGDAGWMDDQGNLFLTGRIKELINRGGEKISPAEVDDVLSSHPAVIEAASFSVPHLTLGEDVACAVVLRSGHKEQVSVADLRRFAAQRLASFKVPRQIYIVDQIPRGELGKPQRRQLAEQIKAIAPLQPVEGTGLPLAPEEDEIFYRLHEIWSRILSRDNLRFDENFFEAGGDSLSAITMLTEVDQRLGSNTSASASSFFDDPTMVHLAELIGISELPQPGEVGSHEIQIFPVREAGEKCSLYCIPADGDEGLYFRRLAPRLFGKMDLSIVRPANTWFKRSLFTTEENGKIISDLLRKAQPQGPYLLAGYCYGGLVAAEAARQLALDGQDARLILFDVQVPGRPSFLQDCSTWLKNVLSTKSGLHDNIRRSPIADLIRLMRRFAWGFVVLFRPLLAPLAHIPGVQRILHQAEKDYFPFYKARPVHAPILHFMCIEDASPTELSSMAVWNSLSRGAVKEHILSFNHAKVFHEANLPVISDTILSWHDSCEESPID